MKLNTVIKFMALFASINTSGIAFASDAGLTDRSNYDKSHSEYFNNEYFNNEYFNNIGLSFICCKNAVDNSTIKGVNIVVSSSSGPIFIVHEDKKSQYFDISEAENWLNANRQDISDEIKDSFLEILNQVLFYEDGVYSYRGAYFPLHHSYEELNHKSEKGFSLSLIDPPLSPVKEPLVCVREKSAPDRKVTPKTSGIYNPRSKKFSSDIYPVSIIESLYLLLEKINLLF